MNKHKVYSLELPGQLIWIIIKAYPAHFSSGVIIILIIIRRLHEST